jgi:cytochrome c oxidase assembly protein subunit 15
LRFAVTGQTIRKYKILPVEIVLKKSNKNIAKWLYLGVIMLVIQIMLGGITRLTESGLSITEWNPITGALPPVSHAKWLSEFNKYKGTDQFRYIHADFSLADFKFIFFWEWFHRLWARLMGVVFLVGFVYFLIKKQFKKDMIIPLIILFLLGMIQGAIGWIMVESGLVPEKMFVDHVKLATHFITALVLLCYTFWFALSVSVPSKMKVISKQLRVLTGIIVTVLFFQLVYGAFMAGLHAATAAPTWPSINGEWIPAAMNRLSPGWKNILDNKITIQFIHRGLAYTLFILVLIWWLKAKKMKGSALFYKTRNLPLILVILQVILGITTVLLSPYGNNLVWFGVAHQLVAILFLMSVIGMLYIIRPSLKQRVYF